MCSNFFSVCLKITSELLKEPLNIFFSNKFDETRQSYQSDQNSDNSICLNTIMSKIKNREYKSMEEWYKEVTLMYQTAINLSTNEKVQIIAKFLLNIFQKKAYGTNIDQDQWIKEIMRISTEINELIEKSPVPQGVDPFVMGIVNYSNQISTISIQQSQWTVNVINELCKIPERFYDIFCILKQTKGDFDHSSDKITVDFDNLPPAAINSLFYYALSFQKDDFEHISQLSNDPESLFITDDQQTNSNDQKASQTSTRNQNSKGQKENQQNSNNSSSAQLISRQAQIVDKSSQQNQTVQNKIQQNNSAQISQHKQHNQSIQNISSSQLNLIQQQNLQNLMNKLNQPNIQNQFIQQNQISKQNLFQQAQSIQQNRLLEQVPLQNQEAIIQHNQIQEKISPQNQAQKPIPQQSQIQEPSLSQSQLQETVPLQNENQEQNEHQNQIQESILQQNQIQESISQQTQIPEQNLQQNQIQELISQQTQIPKQNLQQNQIQEPISQQTQIPEQNLQRNQIQEPISQQTQIPEHILQQSQIQEPISQQTQIPEQNLQQNQIQEPTPQQNQIPEQNLQQSQRQEPIPQQNQIQGQNLLQNQIQEQMPQQNKIQELNLQQAQIPEQNLQQNQIQEPTPQQNKIQELNLQYNQLQDQIKQQFKPNHETKVKSSATDDRQTLKTTQIHFTINNQQEQVENRPEQPQKDSILQPQFPSHFQLQQQFPGQALPPGQIKIQQHFIDPVQHHSVEGTSNQIQDIQSSQNNHTSDLTDQINEEEIVLPTFEVIEKPKNKNILDQLF